LEKQNIALKAPLDLLRGADSISKAELVSIIFPRRTAPVIFVLLVAVGIVLGKPTEVFLSLPFFSSAPSRRRTKKSAV
jgi:hypothetical protein